MFAVRSRSSAEASTMFAPSLHSMHSEHLFRTLFLLNNSRIFENFAKLCSKSGKVGRSAASQNDPLPNTLESYIFKSEAQKRLPPRRAAFPTSTARSSCRICACTTSGPRRCSPRTGRQSYRLPCPLTKLDAHRLERCNRMPLMWISAAK